MTERVLRSRRVALPGGVRPASIHVSGGRIARVAGWDEVPEGAPLHDTGELAILPGLVDTHVHVNEPGRTEWEGFASATRAAAIGGVTTIVDMPLNSVPPTTTLEGLEAKAAATEGKLHVDVAFCGGVVPGNAAELRALRAAGVVAFKCFLCDSGVPEFPAATEEVLRAAMPVLADLDAPLFVHAELPGPLAAASSAIHGALGDDVRRKHAMWLASRPAAAEDEAVALLVGLARQTRARVHVVHLSSSSALDLVAAAKQEGLGFGAETCPHYLHFAAEQIPDGATELKCAPPIRSDANRARLWGGLGQGVIDQVVSDHSPCTPELKRAGGGDFIEAWGGIAGLGLVLPVVWTHARGRGATIDDVVRWVAAAPARLVGLARRKGAIAAGCDADFAVWDPDGVYACDRTQVGHRHTQTPYHGARLAGVVRETWLRGERIWDGTHFTPPRGAIVRGD